MLARRPLGQGAASKKYDVITALGAHACASSKFQQKLTLRFITLVTARYNWQRDELTMGRAEIALLWQVDERTVKRELAKLREAGWMQVKRPSARGRVTTYGIDWDRILEMTRSSWGHVGPDFVARMSAPVEAGQPADPTNTVVRFPSAPTGETEWDRACAILHREDPALHSNWLSAVTRIGLAQGVLELAAPTAFHAQYLATHVMDRLSKAVALVAPDIHRIVIVTM